MQFPTQQSEQAGLAGAVGADQADLVARVEGDVDIVEQRLDAAHQGNLLKTYHVYYLLTILLNEWPCM
jgi:hypothetical protein